MVRAAGRRASRTEENMYTKDALILITVGVILVLVGVGAVTTSAHVAGWLQ